MSEDEVQQVINEAFKDFGALGLAAGKLAAEGIGLALKELQEATSPNK